MKQTTVLIMLLALSFSCIAHISKKKKDKLNQWKGHTMNELVLSWVTPDRTADDRAEGQVVIYSRYRGAYEGNSYYKLTMFYVNSDHLIYSWRITGSSVPPRQVNVSFYR